MNVGKTASSTYLSEEERRARVRRRPPLKFIDASELRRRVWRGAAEYVRTCISPSVRGGVPCSLSLSRFQTDGPRRRATLLACLTAYFEFEWALPPSLLVPIFLPPSSPDSPTQRVHSQRLLARHEKEFSSHIILPLTKRERGGKIALETRCDELVQYFSSDRCRLTE